MPELVDQPSEERSEALYTVVAGEGDGFMLALAAGDTAGGAWELGYSAVTEQATLIAYELIANREIDTDRLVASMLEMDGVDAEERVFRAESAEMRRWLDDARNGSPVAGDAPSLDGAARAAVVGVAHRRDPERVVADSIALGRIFHTDAGSVAAGVLTASAVAASCFAQSGLDLIAGVAETMAQAVAPLTSEFANGDRVATLPQDVTALMGGVGLTTAEEAIERVGGDDTDPVQLVLAGILLAAPVVHRHHIPIEHAARLGGSRLGAVVGAIIGARVGIRAWPWAFANDTWFAEIGRRLVRGPDEVRDLPIPYAVEQHLISGGRPGFH
jgi:ADP-ribosylglycohydrolase